MKRFLPILCISLFLLTSSAYGEQIDTKGKTCTDCHKVKLTDAHKNASCTSCHIKNDTHYAKAAEFRTGAQGCLTCHAGYKNMLTSPMHKRDAEQKFVHESYGKKDPAFYAKNCSSCHVTSCTDCHKGKSVHETVKPKTDACTTCHSGYYTGIEYTGLGVRDDHERHGRGIEHNDELYAKMLPDVHHEKGMQCSACHSMKSLAEGKPFSKTCTDCHKVNKNSSVEHSIPEHMEKMECWTCHSAWASQEYGTFWIRFRNTEYDDYFRWVKTPNNEYAKSSHTKDYTPPPIGINSRGKYSPIRPQYTAFFTYVVGDGAKGKENEMLANNYKALFPHTVRREVVMCESCHKNNKRLMRETEEERIFDLKKDGLEIESFHNKKDFKVTNGRFINDEEYKRITDDDPRYKRLSIKKWKQLKDSVLRKGIRKE